jgi:O-antigen/teichoic acid export membrane protein
VSRLLTPAEVGTAAVGTAVITISISLREFATCAFLIQGHELTRADVRTAFTLQFVLMALISTVLFLVAPGIAESYREPGLTGFMRLVAIALMLDTFAAPITCLLRREMAFGTLAFISVATISVSTVVTIAMAATGFSFMSIAWAWVAASLTTTGLAVMFRPDLRIFLPTLARWHRALAFGGYNGAMTVLTRLYEGLPQLVLGRVLPLEMVGLYNRTSWSPALPTSSSWPASSTWPSRPWPPRFGPDGGSSSPC